MYCEKCGAQNNGNSRFCARCGAVMDESVSVVMNAYEGEPSDYPANMQPPTNAQGNHVSTGGWFGRIMLTQIPIVGFVMLFVWAFGNTLQTSLKTWARAQLIFVLIRIAVIVTAVVIPLIIFANLTTNSVSRASSVYYY